MPVIHQAGTAVQYVTPGFAQHPYPKHGSLIVTAHSTGGIPAPVTAKAMPGASETGDSGGAVIKPASAAAPPVGTAAAALQVGSTTQRATQESLPSPKSASPREQALEQRVRELELQVNQKDVVIKELRASLAKAGVKTSGSSHSNSPSKKKGANESKPIVRYAAVDQDDPIDVRLEEFYNNTGSAIQFRRINRGFYRFGETICEIDVINHKLMARTEDGWNHGKFGPIEKFLVYYENIERQRAGIMLEA